MSKLMSLWQETCHGRLEMQPRENKVRRWAQTYLPTQPPPLDFHYHHEKYFSFEFPEIFKRLSFSKYSCYPRSTYSAILFIWRRLKNFTFGLAKMKNFTKIKAPRRWAIALHWLETHTHVCFHIIFPLTHVLTLMNLQRGRTEEEGGQKVNCPYQWDGIFRTITWRKKNVHITALENTSILRWRAIWRDGKNP